MGHPVSHGSLYSLFKIRFRQCAPYLFVIKSCPIWYISKYIFKEVSGHVFKIFWRDWVIESNQTTSNYKQIRWASTQSMKHLFWTDYRRGSLKAIYKITLALLNIIEQILDSSKRITQKDIFNTMSLTIHRFSAIDSRDTLNYLLPRVYFLGYIWMNNFSYLGYLHSKYFKILLKFIYSHSSITNICTQK